MKINMSHIVDHNKLSKYRNTVEMLLKCSSVFLLPALCGAYIDHYVHIQKHFNTIGDVVNRTAAEYFSKYLHQQ